MLNFGKDIRNLPYKPWQNSTFMLYFKAKGGRQRVKLSRDVQSNHPKCYFQIQHDLRYYIHLYARFVCTLNRNMWFEFG